MRLFVIKKYNSKLFVYQSENIVLLTLGVFPWGYITSKSSYKVVIFSTLRYVPLKPNPITQSGKVFFVSS